MTSKEFMNSVLNGKSDILQVFLNTLADLEVKYCIIGGLGVNAYVDPVVSLDLDVVVATEKIETLCHALKSTFAVERFEHSLNLTSDESDLRIQLQIDSRYQRFIQNAERREVMGYEMFVASLVDVLEGKVWAYLDPEHRRSKRQKDLADILRIVETYPQYEKGLPEEVRDSLI